MLELRWLQVPETTTKPPSLQYRIHQPVVDVGGHLCPGEWTDWTDVPTVVGEPSDTASPSAPVGVEGPLSLLRAGHWREVYIGHRCMRLEVTYDYATWERLMAEVESALALQPAAVGEDIMVNAAHGVFTLPLQPSGLSSGPRFVVHVPAPEQPPAAPSGEVVAWRVPVVQSPFGEWLDHGVRDGLVLVMHRGTHGWKAAGQGHALLAHQLYVKNVEPLCATSHEVAVVGLSGGGWRTVWARSDDDVTHPAPPSAPVGVDEVAWRDAFIAERARRYRSEGMKIEQARIHAETDADLTTALTAQQPAAVSDDDGAEPGEPCESGLPDCGPAVAWDCEGIGACERCARELGWIATPHREPATPP